MKSPLHHRELPARDLFPARGFLDANLRAGPSAEDVADRFLA